MTYTIEQLSSPETYRNDKKLFAMARAIATALYPDRAQWMPFKEEITNGQHPQLVLEHIESIRRAEAAEMQIHNDLVEAFKGITVPANVTMELQGQTIRIATPWDGNDLGKRLSGKGAHWYPEQRVWVYPLDNVLSLPRIFANWQKSQADSAAALQQAEAQRRQQQAEARRQQQAIWDEENRQNAARRQQERAERERAQAVAVGQRVRITAGQYKIGDTLRGRQITGFGKQWTESNLSRGQLYQECEFGRCDNEPVCVDCFMCSKHCRCGTQTTYCYAYFS